MSEQAFTYTTIRALLRLYRVKLRRLPDGRYAGRLPWSLRPGAELTLNVDGGSWSTNDTPPVGGDRLDLIMRMEWVSRERASELLHTSFPAILEAQGIPEEG